MENTHLWHRVHVQANIPACKLTEFHHQLKDVATKTRSVSIQGNATTRAHFNVLPAIVEKLAIQSQSLELKRINFVDTVFDTNELTYLKQGQWIICRVVDNGEEKPNEVIWKLRQVTQNGDNLIWHEMRGLSDIVNWFHSEGVNISGPLDICQPIVSIDTTRVMLGDVKNIWIDFSSWMDMGKAGMYIVGSSELDADGSYDIEHLKLIFDDVEVFSVASKFIACMNHLQPNLLEEIFSDKIEELKLMKAKLHNYPVLLPDQVPLVYRKFHEMETSYSLEF